MNDKSGDWLPGSADGIIGMGGNWKEILANPAKRTLLGMPQDEYTRLTTAYTAAKEIISIPQRDRTLGWVADKNAAIKQLTAVMRDVKKRRFFSPPLIDSDFVVLCLKVKDTEPTAIADPVGLVTATVKYPNAGAIELLIHHVEGSPFDAKANYGVKYKYGVFHADAPAPDDINLLSEGDFTRRKKALVTFDRKDFGKKAVFCFRYENSKGKAGQWGPMVTAVIP